MNAAMVHRRTVEEDTARDVLEKLPRDERPAGRIEEIQEVVEQEEQTDTRLGALWRAKWVRPALVAACGLEILQQLVGVDTIIYYAPTTPTNVDFAKTSAIYANLIIGVINVGKIVRCVGKDLAVSGAAAGWPR